MSDHLTNRLNSLLDIEAEVEARADGVKPPNAPSAPQKYGLAEMPVVEVEVTELNDEQDIDDKALARASIRNVLKTGNANLAALLMLAQSSEHPRAFEVAATFAKTIVDAATKLDDLVDSKSKGNVSLTDASVTNNTTVVMSTEAAMKALREARGQMDIDAQTTIKSESKPTSSE